MYFETCFFLIIDWFIWFARVPLKNRKKLVNNNFLDSNMLVLRILLYLRNYSFSGISFFIKVDQQKRCRPTICNSTISDYINISPIGASSKNPPFGFASSHGTKDIRRSKLCQQQTDWRSFLQPLFLKVYESFLFRLCQLCFHLFLWMDLKIIYGYSFVAPLIFCKWFNIMQFNTCCHINH